LDGKVAKQSKEERLAEIERMREEIENEEEDDFEVEIYAPTGHGMRLPYSRGKAYAQKHFGLDIDSLQRPASDGKPPKTRAKSDPNDSEGDAGESGDDPNANLRFFDRRAQQRNAGSSG
jgi:hypothetical protein